MLAGVMTAAISKIAFAQTEGVITYEVTINMHRNLSPEREGMKAMVPEFRTFKQQLFFNANESLYKPLIEDDDEEENSGGGGGGMRRFRFAGAINYTNPSSTQFLSQMDVFGKKYLITDTLKPAPWKFGTETKTVQGYECMQAYYTTSDERKQTITAWYTTKLPAMLGPERYNTLPGAVLAVDINNAERVIVTKSIEFRPLTKREMKVPDEGQKVTSEEFRKIKEQRNQPGVRVFRN